MITFVFFIVYALCVKRDLFAMILHYIVHGISRNVIFFENQHLFLVSSSTVTSSSTVVLPSFEQQFLDLHPVSSRFQPGIVYTKHSRPQSLSVAHPISDPTTLQIQSVTTPPAPLVRHSPRVSVLSNRYGFPSSSSGNSISAHQINSSSIYQYVWSWTISNDFSDFHI